MNFIFFGQNEILKKVNDVLRNMKAYYCWIICFLDIRKSNEILKHRGNRRKSIRRPSLDNRKNLSVAERQRRNSSDLQTEHQTLVKRASFLVRFQVWELVTKLMYTKYKCISQLLLYNYKDYFA